MNHSTPCTHLFPFQVTGAQIWKCFLNVLFNQTIVWFSMLHFVVHPLAIWTNQPMGKQMLTVPTVIAQFVLIALVQEILVYYFHR